MPTQTIEKVKDKSLKEILQSVLDSQQALTIQMPDGEEIVIQPKPKLKPLPILEGYIPQGWKAAIYNESDMG